MEPRGFEPLTSCLQIGLITRGNGPGLGERPSASDREYPLLTALNGPLMARQSSPQPAPDLCRRGPSPAASVLDVVRGPRTGTGAHEGTEQQERILQQARRVLLMRRSRPLQLGHPFRIRSPMNDQEVDR
ncbi:hypothetical protein GCM10027612_08810 [Microbispora bryophytorum subsp. camponoti]